MAERAIVDIGAEAKAHLEQVAQSFGKNQKWTIDRMVRVHSVEEWRQIFHDMPLDQWIGRGDNPQTEPVNP